MTTPEVSIETRNHWQTEFASLARAYWTADRTEALLRGKTAALSPRESPVLLRALGLLHRDASMPPAQVRKYFQINHMVATLRPALRELADRYGPLNLIDAGCGRSYLSLLLVECFRAREGAPAGAPLRVLGIDRDPAVIGECRRRASAAGLEGSAAFLASSLVHVDVPEAWRSAFGRPADIHGVIALHACDTATCDAIALGVRMGVPLIAVAPCCQAELARGWAGLADSGASGAFAPIWGAPQLRRQLAAQLTDAMRVQLLEAAGYEVRPTEFVPSEHTPKNTLLRAMRRRDGEEAAWARYDALVAATGGVGLGLAATLRRRLRTVCLRTLSEHDAGTTLEGEVGPGPVQEHADAIFEANQEQDVNEEPE